MKFRQSLVNADFYFRHYAKLIVPSKLRLLPSFMVVGAQKCGTTALFSYLCSQPQVLAPWLNETDFFNRRRFYRNNCEDSLKQYAKLFPTTLRAKLQKKRLGKEVITGEATQYLSYTECPARIHALFPEMKIIVLLRDPTERAYSHFLMRQRYGFETRTFFNAFSAEDVGDGMRGPSSYKYRGLYALHLRAWLKCFSKSQMLIMPSRAFLQDSVAAYKKVTDFLGIDCNHQTTPVIKNRRDGKNRSIPSETVWREFFAPYNEQLFNLIGIDYGWNNYP